VEFFSILSFIVSCDIFKAFSASIIPLYLQINSPSLNTKIAFLICFWDFIFAIKSENSGDENSIKGFSSKLKGCLDRYQEERNKDPLSIALLKEIVIDLLPKDTAREVKDGTITSNFSNSS